MGYSFHAVDRTSLTTPPKLYDSAWYEEHPDYYRDYHTGGYWSCSYGLGPDLAQILWIYHAAEGDFTGPDAPAEIIEYYASEDEDAPMSETVRAFLAAPAPEGKVLLYKFDGSDGFIVTPAECVVIDRVIAQWYVDGCPVAHLADRNRLFEFGGYARFCADHGGFSVD